MSPSQLPPATGVPGTRDEHRAARLRLLAREKELNHLRDELAAERRRLPWTMAWLRRRDEY
jgi:predicted dithiol-disulfide oxidoreductase (DUF899 family)